MANLNLLLNIPDAQVARVQDALKTRYSVGTNQDAVEAFRKEIIFTLKKFVQRVERDQFQANLLDIDVT